MVRFLELRDRGRLVRRIFSIAWVFAMALPSRMASSWSQSSRLARKRFISRERSIWHLMQTPVGRCLRKTQFDVLLIFCPPAPEPRTNFSNKSVSRMPSECIRCSSATILSVVMGLCMARLSPKSARNTRVEKSTARLTQINCNFVAAITCGMEPLTKINLHHPCWEVKV
jgi:hypothetical protein